MNYDLAKLSRLIAKIVYLHGGTSSHIDACVVRLPASIFDELLRSLGGEDTMITQSSVATLKSDFTFYGVHFERGESDASIRHNAQARNGMSGKR